MRHTKRMLAAAGLAVLLAGCTLAPTYERPRPELPTDWTTGSTPSAAKQQAPLADWKSVVADKKLAALIESALDNNRDLRAATYRIEQNYSAYEVVRADLFPKIDAFAKAEINPNRNRRVTQNDSSAYHRFVAGVGFSSWELDFFGHVRSLKDQALEHYLSTETAAKSVEFSLIAQLSTMFVRTVADREHYDAAADILKAEETSFELTRQRHAEGAASDLDLMRAKSALAIARTNAAKFKAQAQQDENQLSVLVGKPVKPEQIPYRKLADMTPMNPIPAGVPSEVLFRRPDVLTAEHELKSANAYIGAARALHFPLITLTGSFGTASDKLNGLFKAGSWGWSLMPQASIPIFHTGAINATVDEAFAHRNILIANYEKTVQVAFQEVSDALALSEALNEQVQAQNESVSSSARLLELVNARYEAGQDSSLALMDAKRSYALSRHDSISAREFQQSNVMSLYKALGGGWPGEDEEKKQDPDTKEAARIQAEAQARDEAQKNAPPASTGSIPPASPAPAM